MGPSAQSGKVAVTGVGALVPLGHVSSAPSCGPDQATGFGPTAAATRHRTAHSSSRVPPRGLPKADRFQVDQPDTELDLQRNTSRTDNQRRHGRRSLARSKRPRQSTRGGAASTSVTSITEDTKVDSTFATAYLDKFGFTDRLGRSGQGILEPISAQQDPVVLGATNYDQGRRVGASKPIKLRRLPRKDQRFRDRRLQFRQGGDSNLESGATACEDRPSSTGEERKVGDTMDKEQSSSEGVMDRSDQVVETVDLTAERNESSDSAQASPQIASTSASGGGANWLDANVQLSASPAATKDATKASPCSAYILHGKCERGLRCTQSHDEEARLAELRRLLQATFRQPIRPRSSSASRSQMEAISEESAVEAHETDDGRSTDHRERGDSDKPVEQICTSTVQRIGSFTAHLPWHRLGMDHADCTQRTLRALAPLVLAHTDRIWDGFFGSGMVRSHWRELGVDCLHISRNFWDEDWRVRALKDRVLVTFPPRCQLRRLFEPAAGGVLRRLQKWAVLMDAKALDQTWQKELPGLTVIWVSTPMPSALAGQSTGMRDRHMAWITRGFDVGVKHLVTARGTFYHVPGTSQRWTRMDLLKRLRSRTVITAEDHASLDTQSLQCAMNVMAAPATTEMVDVESLLQKALSEVSLDNLPLYGALFSDTKLTLRQRAKAADFLAYAARRADCQEGVLALAELGAKDQHMMIKASSFECMSAILQSDSFKDPTIDPPADTLQRIMTSCVEALMLSGASHKRMSAVARCIRDMCKRVSPATAAQLWAATIAAHAHLVSDTPLRVRSMLSLWVKEGEAGVLPTECDAFYKAMDTATSDGHRVQWRNNFVEWNLETLSDQPPLGQLRPRHRPKRSYTWNLNGFGHCWRDRSIHRFVERFNPDFLHLTETKINEAGLLAFPDLKAQLRAWGYNHVLWYWCGDSRGSGNFGTAVFSRYAWDSYTFGIGVRPVDIEGRNIIVRYTGVTMIGSYTPCTKAMTPTVTRLRVSHDTRIREIIQLEANTQPVVYMGDLNVAPTAADSSVPAWGAASNPGTKVLERASFSQLQAECKVVDAYRAFHPRASSADFTWETAQGRAHPQGMARAQRLDYMMVAAPLMPFVKSCSIARGYRGSSDHCPVGMVLVLPDVPGKEVSDSRMQDSVASLDDSESVLQKSVLKPAAVASSASAPPADRESSGVDSILCEVEGVWHDVQVLRDLDVGTVSIRLPVSTSLLSGEQLQFHSRLVQACAEELVEEGYVNAVSDVRVAVRLQEPPLDTPSRLGTQTASSSDASSQCPMVDPSHECRQADPGDHGEDAAVAGHRIVWAAASQARRSFMPAFSLRYGQARTLGYTLADTGASCNMITRDFAARVGSEEIYTHPSARPTFVLANNSRSKPSYLARVSVEMTEGYTTQVLAWVCESLPYDCILGSRQFSEMGAIFDYRRGRLCLIVDGEEVTIPIDVAMREHALSAVPLRANRDYVLRPQEHRVLGVHDTSGSNPYAWGLVQDRADNVSSGFMAAKGSLPRRPGRDHVVVMSVADSNIVIRKGQPVAWFHPDDPAAYFHHRWDAEDVGITPKAAGKLDASFEAQAEELMRRMDDAITRLELGAGSSSETMEGEITNVTTAETQNVNVVSVESCGHSLLGDTDSCCSPIAAVTDCYDAGSRSGLLQARLDERVRNDSPCSDDVLQAPGLTSATAALAGSLSGRSDSGPAGSGGVDAGVHTKEGKHVTVSTDDIESQEASDGITAVAGGGPSPTIKDADMDRGGKMSVPESSTGGSSASDTDAPLLRQDRPPLRPGEVDLQTFPYARVRAPRLSDDALRMSDVELEEVWNRPHMKGIKVDAEGKYTTEQVRRVKEIAAHFDSIWNLGGGIPVSKADLGVVGSFRFKKPFKGTCRSRRYTPQQRQVVEKMIADQLEAGIIEPSVSPYSSNFMLVPKSTPGQFRMVVDLKGLNECIENEPYMLPRLDECLSGMNGCSFFSNVDMKDGFWQCPLDEESRPATSFDTHMGRFQYRKLPQGCKISPGCFQRVVDKMLAGLRYHVCCAYIDDICIYTRTFEEHCDALAAIFSRLKEFDLSISAKKTELLSQTFTFLGHSVSSQGITMDPDKIKAVKEMPLPNSMAELRSFLGVTGWSRSFIKDYARRVHSLTQLTKKGARLPRKKDGKVQWTEEQLAQIEDIRAAVCSPPVLVHPDWSKPFELHTDACGHGLGAVLTQQVDDKARVVHYASRALTDTETRYSTYEQELLAVVWAIQLFKVYLTPVWGQSFIVYTDSKAVEQILSSDKNGRCRRWQLLLSSYDYKVVHRSATKMAHADGLSRCHLLDTCPYGQEPSPDILDQRNVVAVATRSANSRKRQRGVPVAEAPKPRKRPTLRRSSRKETVDSQASSKGHQDVGSTTRRPAVEHDTLERTDDGRTTTVRAPVDAYFPPMDAEAWDLQQVARLQAEDEGLSKLRAQVDSAQVTGFSVDSVGVLRRDNTELGRPGAIVVPTSLRAFVLRQHHGLPLSGHPGTRKLRKLLRHRFWWNGMSADVKRWTAACLTCRLRKTPKPTKQSDAHMMLSPRPFHTVAVDLTVCLPDTDVSEYRYVLTMIDTFTRWVIAVPLKDKKPATVGQAIFDALLTKHGPIKRILTDEGGEFVNEALDHLAERWKIRRITTGPRSSHRNGHCERFHRTFHVSMTILVARYGKEWHHYVSACEYVYRISVSDATGYSPWELVCKTKPPMPLDTCWNLEPELSFDSEWAYDMHTSERFAKVCDEVRKTQEKAARVNQARRQREIDERRERTGRQKTVYKVNDLVLVWQPQQRVVQRHRIAGQQDSLPAKWTFNWTGPHIVIGKAGKESYTVKDGRTGRLMNKMSAELMSPFEPWSFEHPSTSPETDPDRSFLVGGFVQQGHLLVVPIDPEKATFGVGRLLRVDRDDDLLWQWMSNAKGTCGPTSVYRPGWINTKGHVWYGEQREGYTPYTNFDSDTPAVTNYNVVLHGFGLNPKSDTLPAGVRRMVLHLLPEWIDKASTTSTKASKGEAKDDSPYRAARTGNR